MNFSTIRGSLNFNQANNASDLLTSIIKKGENNLQSLSKPEIEIFEKARHLKHKYFEIKNGRYIYKQDKMSVKDHKDAADVHNAFSKMYRNGGSSDQANYHDGLAKVHGHFAEAKKMDAEEKASKKAGLSLLKLSDEELIDEYVTASGALDLSMGTEERKTHPTFVRSSAVTSELIKRQDAGNSGLYNRAIQAHNVKHPVYSNPPEDDTDFYPNGKPVSNSGDNYDYAEEEDDEDEITSESTSVTDDGSTGVIMMGGKALTTYEFDRGSDSFWLHGTHKSFDKKQEMFDYVKNNQKLFNTDEADSERRDAKVNFSL